MENSHDIEKDSFDRGIVPAETAARQRREGENYKQKQETEVAEGSIDTSAGATISNEGLANNYAIEPEMYINEPGDLREEEEGKE
jgi:hypothetical protein